MTTKEMNRYRSRLVDLTTKYVNLSSDGLTASMINMAETAARSYWIALVASLIALLSAAAAWVAVFVQIVGNMKQLYL